MLNSGLQGGGGKLVPVHLHSDHTWVTSLSPLLCCLVQLGEPHDKEGGLTCSCKP